MPMAGHKRPHGWPICPPRQSPGPGTGKSREPTPDFIPRIGDIYHLKNPNYVDHFPSPSVPEFRRERAGSPCTWVSTEPADDIPGPSTSPNDHLRRQRPAQEAELIGYTTPQASMPSETSSTTARIRRTLSSFITNTVPAVTLFSTPHENVQTLTRTARLNGLYTGIMRRPRSQERRSLESVGRRYSWWVLMGRDPVAVEHLITLQEQQTMSHLEGRYNHSPPSTVAVHPPSQASLTIVHLVLCCVGSAIISVLFYSIL
ncbi:uncharacterized protein PHACADRAFT_250011 [Phanerochaete carnosa HHB-10118-sp]|uniref:Uncharacterized protein n=1 Tax=Phanerochaete carnosa (strain HHB-10118-sp) TaxID=650164 RepID=K5X9C1_PHACS|nr:uncharacterized protein PHACADRAFT_250011 [Phanerochaete carnosa HHB-10118-sp]EKM59487.1 hypothetical protein PHACADRAFT_250011 [Phanerochaete carnosa HHB-10118-sp]